MTPKKSNKNNLIKIKCKHLIKNMMIHPLLNYKEIINNFLKNICRLH